MEARDVAVCAVVGRPVVDVLAAVSSQQRGVSLEL